MHILLVELPDKNGFICKKNRRLKRRISGVIGPSIRVQIPNVENNLQVSMIGPVANVRGVIFPLEMCVIQLIEKKAMTLVLIPGASSTLRNTSFKAGIRVIRGRPASCLFLWHAP